jgi:hypothetical protein
MNALFACRDAGVDVDYRVEYNGAAAELANLDAALDSAKQAIAADVGPVSGWTVEHDESINDWFVQGVVNGQAVGATAVVAGPEPMLATPSVPQYAPVEVDGVVRRRVFTAETPADALGTAANWLAGRSEAIAVDDLGWRRGADGFELRVYYRS